MSRIYNFSAGPAALPEEVLQQAQAELTDWQGSGMSVMEMSHRGKEFLSIAEAAEADVRELMGVPNDYKVLFLQGGASSQFAAVPMNLLSRSGKADYFRTGSWSKKAIAEAKRYGDISVTVDREVEGRFCSVPGPNDFDVSTDAAYVHYTPNETIEGVEFPYVPAIGAVPLVADMSSTILSRPIDVTRFGLIYAGAQKNIGPAGLTLVIVRADLMGNPLDGTPTMFDYAAQAAAGSMYNTPPTYAWYLAGLVFQWLRRKGGLEGMAEINRRKAEALYAAIDDSSFYANPVDIDCRSWMNVPFTLADSALDGEFLKQAGDAGLKTLKGHRSVGGMRASIYNAMPEEGVTTLIDFMREFERARA